MRTQAEITEALEAFRLVALDAPGERMSLMAFQSRNTLEWVLGIESETFADLVQTTLRIAREHNEGGK